jgi:hypothetical protein
MSPSARSSRISALENMLSSSSSAMVSMASQLSEAEERERVFNGKGRWYHVRSLPEAKNIMNYLFQLASSARYAVIYIPSKDFMMDDMYALSWFPDTYFLYFASRSQVLDKEVICNEKEHTITELKEKVVVLNGGIRQLETQVRDLRSQNTQVKILQFVLCKFHGTKLKNYFVLRYLDKILVMIVRANSFLFIQIGSFSLH